MARDWRAIKIDRKHWNTDKSINENQEPNNFGPLVDTAYRACLAAHTDRKWRALLNSIWRKGGKSNGKKREKDGGFTKFRGKWGKCDVWEGKGEMRQLYLDSDLGIQVWILWTTRDNRTRHDTL